METICDDLAAEHAALDTVLDAVIDWDAATPADGWSIRDTVSHLWFFDQRALLAITDPDAFAEDMTTLLARGVDASIEPGRAVTPGVLMASWRADRTRLIDAARALDPSTRVPWYGPAMSARSFITARLMETWAHGQDVVDVVGVDRPATARLRHIAHIGVRARPYSYLVNDRALPDGDVEVRLVGPDGDAWSWGASATDRVTGSALDFCLLVTQRRHLSDTRLVVEGPAASEWMSFAQAFAGPAGPGTAPARGRPIRVSTVSWPPRPLRTDRLVVRAVTPDDVEAIVVLLTDPDVRRHLGGPVDDDTVAAVRAGPIGQRWGVFGIVDVSTSELVGTVSLDRERDGELEISYQLLHQRWGAGLAGEAVSAVIDWAWSTTQDRSVIAVTQAANERSVRLLDRLGFVAEREMIEHGERQVLLRLSAPAPLTDR